MIKANVRGHVIDYAAILNGNRNWVRGLGSKSKSTGWRWKLHGGMFGSEIPPRLIIKSEEWCDDQWSPIV